jgi:hypothetical protein
VIGYAPDHVTVANDFVELLTKKRNQDGDIPDLLPEVYKYVTEGIKAARSIALSYNREE